jgi:hypothetical protein
VDVELVDVPQTITDPLVIDLLTDGTLAWEGIGEVVPQQQAFSSPSTHHIESNRTRLYTDQIRRVTTSLTHRL